MYYTVNELLKYELKCEDGLLGRTNDFLFDDRDWVIRYIVADTGTWLPKKKVLLSPKAVGKPDLVRHELEVFLTKGVIENSPELDEHAPVSRQHEIEMHKYYSWPAYWGEIVSSNQDSDSHQVQNVHLRSTNELAHSTGYQINSIDGKIGHLEDFIFDKSTWKIRYIVVDTESVLFPKKKVIFSPDWVDSINWENKLININHSKEEIENSPEFDPLNVHRDYETQLFTHYKREFYWES